MKKAPYIPSRQGCHCPNPLADARDMTCVWCGHQIGGVAIPSKRSLSTLGDDRSTFVSPKRKFRPAA